MLFNCIFIYFHDKIYYRVLPLPTVEVIKKDQNTQFLIENNENEISPFSKNTEIHILKSFQNFKKYLKKFKREVEFDFENSSVRKNENKITELTDDNCEENEIEDEVVEEEVEEEGECSVNATPAQQLLLDILKR